MRQLSKKEQFYKEVGEAMSIGEAMTFINIENLKVEIHARLF